MKPKLGTGRPMAYATKDGKRCPSVTTILSRFKDSSGLISWSNKLGFEGTTLEDEQKRVARVGTVAHGLIQDSIMGRDPKWQIDYLAAPEEMKKEAWSLYESWLDWAMSAGFSGAFVEWPVVSEEYRVGGTIDVVGRTPSGLVICDWKRADAAYVDQLLQLSAYRTIWNEIPKRPSIDLASVVLLGGKEAKEVSFDHGDLSMGWDQFRRLLDAYNAEGELRKRIKK